MRTKGRHQALAWRAAAVVMTVLSVLAVNGCSSNAAPSPAARQRQITFPHARQVFATFVTAQDVARAARDEPLELSLVTQAQLPLSVSAYERADYLGMPTPRYRYGPPTLYIPQLKGFPFWFVAVARRTPAQGGTPRTAITVFSRVEASDTWQLSLLTLLQPGTKLPQIRLDATGHAMPLATFQQGLLVSPNSVGALQSAVADSGRAAVAATVVAAGPYTTGLHERLVAAERQVSELGLHYDSVFIGTAFPLYALRTTDGGGLVLYSLSHSTVIKVPDKNHTPIEVPAAFAPILYATGRLVQTELDTGETFQYAAYVPPGSRTHGGMRVIAADGGPTSAGGT